MYSSTMPYYGNQFNQGNYGFTPQVPKILDAVKDNRMADMQNQINALQMQNAMCGVVRYPMMSTYNSGNNPFCGQCCPGM